MTSIHAPLCVLIQSVRLLAIVRFPGAFGNLHVGEHCLETGFFRAARIDSEPDLSRSFPHMAYTHLGEVYTIL